MKEPFFNDISTQPFCITDAEVKERISAFVKILGFCGAIGFEKVRFEKSLQEILLKENYILHEYISNHLNESGTRLILSMIRRPYLDENSEAEEKYVNSKIRLVKDGKEVEAEGIACAYLVDGFAVGFASEDFWRNKTLFTINVLDQISETTTTKHVFCISDVQRFEDDNFINWAVKTLPIKFKSCNKPQTQKETHFRDDHGKEKLQAFAKRILKEDYVVEVINSLPFHPHAKDIIGKVYDNGLIDIILTDSDQGYGMVIKTTAETRALALYMAADIRKKYS